MKILIVTGTSRNFIRVGVDEFKRRVKHAGWAVEEVSLSEFLENPPSKISFDDLAAAGGDGTINALVNAGISWPLLILPAGTGNDLGRSLRIYSIADSLRYLLSGRRTKIDLGVLRSHDTDEKTKDRKDHLFANGVGLGLDGLVARGHSRGVAYSLGIVREIFRQPVFRGRFTFGNKTRDLEYLSLLIANGRFFGNGYRLAPKAHLDDGCLDIVIIKPTGRITALKNLLRARKGKHLDHPSVEFLRCHSLTMESDSPIPLHIDGEPFAFRTLEVRVRPAALPIYGILP